MMHLMPIDESTPRDKEILVYVNVASVDIVRLASWSDGEFWQDQGFDSQDDARGWWAYENSVSQTRMDDYLTPTHWAPFTAPAKNLTRTNSVNGL